MASQKRSHSPFEQENLLQVSCLLGAGGDDPLAGTHLVSTARYCMGGVAVDLDLQVLTQKQFTLLSELTLEQLTPLSTYVGADDTAAILTLA
jgi:hypothetical protein